jgi:hypothetical protein
MKITNLGEGHDPSTNKPYKLRTVTTIVDNDRFTLEKVVSMAHTRKKP